MNQPTEQLPPIWHTGPGYPSAPPPPPPPPKSPRWLWIAAAAAVLLVAGLVLALVIVSSNSRESTVVAPPQTTSSTATRPVPTTTVRTPQPTTTTRAPLPIPTATVPQPTESTEPSDSEAPAPAPAGSETVVYSVSGEGRAINITYVDTGGVMQTEFNVALPWSKEVSLSAPAKNSASVAVVNVGRDVTCSVSVNGAQVRQRTGRGLTICTGVA
jgi:cytoskeletal protein RodZ